MAPQTGSPPAPTLEQLAGLDVQVRFVWSDITATSARWRQAFRVADGDWDENWEMSFTRPSPEAVL